MLLLTRYCVLVMYREKCGVHLSITARFVLPEVNYSLQVPVAAVIRPHLSSYFVML